MRAVTGQRKWCSGPLQQLKQLMSVFRSRQQQEKVRTYVPGVLTVIDQLGKQDALRQGAPSGSEA